MKKAFLFFALAFLASCTTAKQAPEPCPLPHNIYNKETGRPICAHRFYNQ